MTASQKVASVPAQSAEVVHARLAPRGGRRQNEGETSESQAYPPLQSADVVQPVFVQYPPPASSWHWL